MYVDVQGVIMYTRQDLFVPPEKRMMLLYRSIAGFSSISFAFYAVSQMVLADASVIIFTSPVMTFFFVRTCPLSRMAMCGDD